MSIDLLIVISQEILPSRLQPSIAEISLKISYLQLH